MVLLLSSENIQGFYMSYADRSCPLNSEELMISAPVCVSLCSHMAQDHGSTAFSLQTTETGSCACRLCSLDTSIINTGSSLFIGEDDTVFIVNYILLIVIDNVN